jgi:hypothetical protein
MKRFWTYCTLFCLLVLAKPCSAQVCLPGEVQPESGYAYIRSEIKALRWMRSALLESQKMQTYPPTDDPKDFHKTVEFYSVVQRVSDDYDCAARILSNYKDSKNESIHTSVDALLTDIQGTKDINAQLVALMESLNKATTAEDIDQVAIAKALATIKSAQGDAMTLAMGGAKMSTFGILAVQSNGYDAKPTAFTITAAQRGTLLADARDLAKVKSNTYVDNCANILVSALTRELPTAAL